MNKKFRLLIIFILALIVLWLIKSFTSCGSWASSGNEIKCKCFGKKITHEAFFGGTFYGCGGFCYSCKTTNWLR